MLKYIIIAFILVSIYSESYSKWMTIEKRKYQSEKDFKAELDSNISNLNFIEGIWNVKEIQYGVSRNTFPKTIYRIGIVKDSIIENWEYTAFIIESSYPNWEKGMIKGRFRKMAYENIFEGLWYTYTFKKIQTESLVSNYKSNKFNWL